MDEKPSGSVNILLQEPRRSNRQSSSYHTHTTRKDQDQIQIDANQLMPQKARPKLKKVPGRAFKVQIGFDYDDLEEYINKTHIRQRTHERKKFSCCKTSLGSLAFGSDARELTDPEKEMG